MLYITKLCRMASGVCKAVYGLSPNYIQNMSTTKNVTYNFHKDTALSITQ